MNNLNIPVSIGELLDKVSILKIKIEKITDKEKLFYISRELVELEEKSIFFTEQQNIKDVFEELLLINKKLWETEDLIRKKETLGEFDSDFIQLARSVYITNDLRFVLKNKINEITNSEIKEQKSY